MIWDDLRAILLQLNSLLTKIERRGDDQENDSLLVHYAEQYVA